MDVQEALSSNLNTRTKSTENTLFQGVFGTFFVCLISNSNEKLSPIAPLLHPIRFVRSFVVFTIYGNR